jgi:hypothetical protein
MFPRDTDQQRELIYNEQVKTNALLEQLIELSKPAEITREAQKPNERTAQKTRRKA